MDAAFWLGVVLSLAELFSGPRSPPRTMADVGEMLQCPQATAELDAISCTK
jgi:hypothetical protein